MALDRVRAQRRAQLRHHGGGRRCRDRRRRRSRRATWPRPSAKASYQSPPRLVAARRQVAARQLQAAGDAGRSVGSRRRCSASASWRCSYSVACSIAIAARSAASCSRSVSSSVKCAATSAADVQHAEHALLDEQRHAEQRADALLAQDRVEDVGVVDVLDDDRRAARPRCGRRSPARPGSCTPCSTSSSMPLAARARSSRARLVEQQDRGRVACRGSP